MKKSAYGVFLITLVGFATYFFISKAYFDPLRMWVNTGLNQLGFSHILTYIIVGVPICISVMLLHRPKKLLRSLGLHGHILRALAFALICTSPMFLGYAFVFEWNNEITLNEILITVVAAGFFEELYFRGFLFGQPFRYTRLGFIPSVALGAVIFGIVHLYQGNSPGELMGIFAVTFMGAGWFAWLYTQWNYNLWVPIFLHMLMNAAWGMFSAGDNALGDVYSNIFRVATIALSIILTIAYKRRRGMPMEVNRSTLWMKT